MSEKSRVEYRPLTCFFSMTLVICACSTELKFEKSMVSCEQTCVTWANNLRVFVATCCKFPDSSTSNTTAVPSHLCFTSCPVFDANLDNAISFKDALSRMENSRVKSTRPLIPPQILQEDLPLYVSPDPSSKVLTTPKDIIRRPNRHRRTSGHGKNYQR